MKNNCSRCGIKYLDFRWRLGQRICILCIEDELSATLRRADSAELGCEIAYRREPTQAEGDAHEYGAPNRRDRECFVPMGGWTGRRCHGCRRWVWGGPTSCAGCVPRTNLAEERELRQADRDLGLSDWRALGIRGTHVGEACVHARPPMTEGEIVDLEVRVLTGTDEEKRALAVEHFPRLLKFAREMVDQQDLAALDGDACCVGF